MYREDDGGVHVYQQGIIVTIPCFMEFWPPPVAGAEVFVVRLGGLWQLAQDFFSVNPLHICYLFFAK
jgi:hypothetical protein